MKFRARLIGSKESKAILDRLPEAVSQSVLRRAIVRAMTPFADEARASAPRRATPTGAGHGADTIKPRVVDRDLPGGHVVVSPTKDRFYLYFGEIGTAHQAARPFFRPAWDRTKEPIGQALIDEIDAGVLAAAKGISRRAGL